MRTTLASANDRRLAVATLARRLVSRLFGESGAQRPRRLLGVVNDP